MKPISLLIATALLLALPTSSPADNSKSATTQSAPKHDSALDPVEDVAGLPRVLLIGDSISIGYTLPTRALLKGKTNVHRPPTNCSSTGNGLANLASWLGSKKWDVIHFNFGLHDAKLPPEGVRHSPPDVYEKNLRELVARMKATGAKLIWATTTPVPNGGNLSPTRRFASVDSYNAIAKRVMDENGVAMDDLNAAVAPRMNELLIHKTGAQGVVQWDVHFVPEGYALLAKHVAASVEKALAKP